MRSRGDTLAAHWAALEKHFQHHAKLVARFRETGRETLVAGICVEPGYPELGSGIMLRQRWQGSSLIVECMKVRQCSPETQCQRIGGTFVDLVHRQRRQPMASRTSSTDAQGKKSASPREFASDLSIS